MKSKTKNQEPRSGVGGGSSWMIHDTGMETVAVGGVDQSQKFDW